jgi:hypothetical protein
MGLLANKDKSQPKSGEVLPPEAKVADQVSKEVSAKEEKPPLATSMVEVGKASLPAAFMEDIDSGNTGLDQVSAKDLIIPRLTILQKLSPQLEARKPEFIPDAQAGDFCDVALGDVFRDSLKILPCYFATVYLEWAPKRAGLVHNHGLDATILKKCKRDEKGRHYTSKELGAEHDGNNIVETATWFVINLTAGGRKSFLPLSSTQLKSSRKMLTLITNQRITRGDGSEFQPPIFYRAFNASLSHESNAEGDWFGWKFEPAETVFELDPSKNLLATAKEFLEQARSGLVQGDLSSYADDGTNTERGERIDGETNKTAAM